MLCLECSHPLRIEDKSCPNCGSQVPENASLRSTVPYDGSQGPTLDDALEFAPGASFAERFTIVEKTGEGGMGMVYKAIDRTLNQVVALKLIRPELASVAELVERFKREVRLTRQITHPNVCRVHDIGEHEGVFFLSMEWIEGETLSRLLKQTGPLEEERALLIAEKIARALEAVHARGVIHRDLKPGNVMIDGHGEVYVMDFGIARERDSDFTRSAGRRLGTPLYMAPEQRRGEEPDARTDLYALGLILREMLTGHRPDPGEGGPSGVRIGANGRIGTLLKRLLSEDRDKRPASAEEVTRSLENIRRGLTWSGRIRGWVQQYPQRTVVLTTAITLAAAAGAWYMVGPVPKPAPFRQPEARVYYDRGMHYLREESESVESLDSAIQMFNRSLSSDSTFVLSWAGLGEAYWMRFETTHERSSREEAKMAIAKASSLAPALPGVRSATARGHLVEGDFLKAKSELEKATAARSDFDVAWEYLGRAHQELGEYDAGLLALQKAIDLQPDSFRHQIALGNFYKRFSERTEAIEAYRDAIALKPDSRMAWNNLGIVYSQSNRFAEAVKAFTRSLELEDRAITRSNLGTAYFFLGRLEAAEAGYRKAVGMEPGNAIYQGNLGDALWELDRTDEAQQCYREAVRLAKESAIDTPDDPETNMTLGLWCAKIGDAEGALAAGNRAAQLQPENANILYVNALIRCLLGMTSEALNWLERAARIGLGRAQMENEPCFQDLSGDPRYTRILQLSS